MTEPPKKAVLIPCTKLDRTMWAVLTLARVATHMPMYPAPKEAVVPMAKAKATWGAMKKAKTTVMEPEKSRRAVNSRLRKTEAPRRMAPAILIILLLPSSFRWM